MYEQQRLQYEIDESQQRWKGLSDRITRFQKELDIETRVEEKLRLQSMIKQLEDERECVENRLQDYEKTFKHIEKSAHIVEARRRERNQAYSEAIHTWELVRDHDPHDPQIDREIQRLEALQQRAQLLKDRIRQLSPRMKDIWSIYAQLVQRMNQMMAEGGEDAAVLALVDSFLVGALSAADLTTMWKMLAGEPTPTPIPTINFRALADRMKRGEIVLFLGSDIARLFDTTVLDVVAMVSHLAGQASYHDFIGSLSMIAEYYQMKPEYGRASLVRNLHALLPDISLRVPLYELLASITQPLVMVSAAYDTLLERTLQSAGKQYVVITSLLNTDSDAEVGQILLQYSEQAIPEFPCLEQELSQLDLLAKGYSLIYKIRGSLGPRTHQGVHQQNALTLSEENYFTFARHMDKLVHH